MELTPASLRVLGSLMEKEMTTPDTYPLSLNSLVAACNQRSSREPVMDLTEDQVRGGLEELEVESLVNEARENGRVTKYEHRIRTVLNLRRDETAVMCLLTLRGPQTPGELRSRSDRMFQFDDLAQVQSTLERMASRELPLVVQLARQPGSREARWAHLIGGPVTSSVTQATERASAPPVPDEFASLRAQVERLEERVTSLEQRLASPFASEDL